MKKYIRIAAVILAGYLLAAALLNLWLRRSAASSDGNPQLVEINRIAAGIMETGEAPDLTSCRYVTGVELLRGEYSQEELRRFAGLENQPYVLVPMSGSFGMAKIYYRTEERPGYGRILVILNTGLFVVLLFFIGLFFYIGKEILLPFSQIRDMPCELSRGTLSNAVPESKNRYFGRFTWGLDMLRERLEGERRRTLRLEKEKKTLVLSLSHDIKTPLGTIRMGVKALKAGLYETREEQEDVLDRIEKSALSVETHLAEMMETVKSDFLNMEVRKEVFYLKEVLEQTAAYYTEKAELCHVDFQIAPFDDCLLSGDKNRLIEVLQNLMDNALKYGDGRKIRIWAGKEEGWQKISVLNTGRPIPKEEQNHIFESFYRGSNAGGKQGNGLGLYICRQIMNRMDGEVFAEPLEDGVCFSVVMPVK